MKNNKLYLIFACISIIIIFSSSTLANDDITIDNTSQINLKNSDSSISQTYVVNGSAYNQMENPTIQNTINIAKNGDIIEITGTEYVHCHFVVNKNLTIKSTVETKMTPCPSNTEGSNGIGIFYIAPEASGTILTGFTLINDEFKSGSVDPYCIYVNGASNVKIENCTVEKTTYGPGIFVKDSTNLLISNTTVENSQKGIYLENTKGTLIKNNNISSNNVAGIYVGANSNNLNISENLIKSNNYYGIYLGSATNTIIYSNRIIENRDNPVAARAKEGTGIFVDTTVTNLQILGNLIKENGEYGIYDSYKFTNMVDQYVQVINGNYFIRHSERAVFHANPQNQTTIVYVWSNYYVDELFCGGTCYEPGVLIGNHERDLIMSEISEVKNGVYTVSFIRKDTKEIATTLSSIDITFFLNKKNNYPLPQTEDVYRIVNMKNGVAIADFRNETYLPTGNTITAVGLGFGVITNESSGPLPSQIYDVPNSHIPTNESKIATSIVVNSLNKYYGNKEPYKLTLTGDNKPLANKTVIITINGVNYTRKTNENGEASININLGKGIYNVLLSYSGDDNYKPSSFNDNITIKSTVDGKDITKYFRNGTQYSAKFFDCDGNILKNKAITFNINGVFYTRTTDNNGMAKLNINLGAGEYIITALNQVTNELSSNIITVLPIIVENNNIVKYFRNGTQYTVKLLDSQGNIAPGANVVFNINGVFYNRVSDSNGIAKLNINLNMGDYIITAQYNDYLASNIITVLPIIESDNIKMSTNNRIPFTATLLDDHGNPVKGQTARFNVNGVFYDRISDDNGIAKLNIRLGVGKYIITTEYNGCFVSNTIEVTDSVMYSTRLITDDSKKFYGETDEFTAILVDENNNRVKNQNILFSVNGKTYSNVTDLNGVSKIKLNLEKGEYTVTSKYLGSDLYLSSFSTNDIIVENGTVVGKASNLELQNIINLAKPNDVIKLTADNYDNISLVINKPLVLTTLTNSTLNGDNNKNVITLDVDGALIEGFKITVNNGTGIELNGNDNEIKNCIIKNNLDLKLIDKYNTGKIKKPGYGIEINNCENNKITGNMIYDFYNGIFLKNTKENQINNNIITKNNYGIEFGENVSNTVIQDNEINNNTGLITMAVVEGPLGYGISIRESGVNVSILNNNINNNYEGIFIDAKNCTGIKIIGNSISNSTIEGITFNVNYTYSENAIQPIVENNAIYNNAKGPSMITLGEISANPAGIYGPGEWNESLRLHLGANWYGTNNYTTWGNETGAGTICPRISTTLITFNMSYIEPGKYEIRFYNNGTLANTLPDFTLYFTLNFNTDKEIEKIANVHNGVATISFPKENYYETGNIIEGSSGSLFDETRLFRVIYTYNVKNSEIPKIS